MVTLGQVKAILQIKDSQKDALLNEMITLVGEYLENYVGWTDLTVIKMIEFHLNQKAGLDSEGLSRHSVSFSTDYPTSITKGLRRKITWA